MPHIILYMAFLNVKLRQSFIANKYFDGFSKILTSLIIIMVHKFVEFTIIIDATKILYLYNRIQLPPSCGPLSYYTVGGAILCRKIGSCGNTVCNLGYLGVGGQPQHQTAYHLILLQS